MTITRKDKQSMITYDNWDWGLQMLSGSGEWNDWLGDVDMVCITLNPRKLSQSLKSEADKGEESNSKI